MNDSIKREQSEATGECRELELYRVTDSPFLYTLGFIPFILVKKRVNDAVSEKCRRSAIWTMGSEVCCSM